MSNRANSLSPIKKRINGFYFHSSFNDEDKNYSCDVINNTNISLHSESPWGFTYSSVRRREERHFQKLEALGIRPIKISECVWQKFCSGQISVSELAKISGSQLILLCTMSGPQFIQNFTDSGICLKPLSVRRCVRGAVFFFSIQTLALT